MTDVETIPMPETVEFTDAQLEAECDQGGDFSIVREGVMRVDVVKAEKSIQQTTTDYSKRGDFKLKLDLAPVGKDGKRLDTATASLWLDVPVSNPAVTGHAAPKIDRKTYRFARAIDPTIPTHPLKQDDGTYLIRETDERIDKEQKRLLSKKVDLEVKKASVKWLNDTQALVDERFFARIIHKKKGDKTYANCNYMSADADGFGDSEILTDNFFIKV